VQLGNSVLIAVAVAVITLFVATAQHSRSAGSRCAAGAR
jgi:hypothetical protein